MSKYRPKEGEKYWYVDTTMPEKFMVSPFKYSSQSQVDKNLEELGNRFETKEQALRVAAKIRMVLKED